MIFRKFIRFGSPRLPLVIISDGIVFEVGIWHINHECLRLVSNEPRPSSNLDWDCMREMYPILSSENDFITLTHLFLWKRERKARKGKKEGARGQRRTHPPRRRPAGGIKSCGMWENVQSVTRLTWTKGKEVHCNMICKVAKIHFGQICMAHLHKYLHVSLKVLGS